LSWYFLYRHNHIPVTTEGDAGQAALRRPGDRLTGGRIKHPFMAWTIEPVSLRLVVDAAREVRTLLTVGDDLSAWEMQ
jgi:hypothetical protein